MVGTAIWLGLIVVAGAWEVRCHRPGSRWTSLTGVGTRIGSSWPGRLALVVIWAFIGWHVFARYTIPT